MSYFFPDSEDLSAYIRTHAVLTEEKPYAMASDQYLSFWMFMPADDDSTGQTGDLCQYFVEYSNGHTGNRQACVSDVSHQGISRDQAIAIMLDIEQQNTDKNRPLVDMHSPVFAAIAEKCRYHDIPHAPIDAVRDDNIVNAVCHQGSPDKINIKRMGPKR